MSRPAEPGRPDAASRANLIRHVWALIGGRSALSLLMAPGVCGWHRLEERPPLPPTESAVSFIPHFSCWLIQSQENIKEQMSIQRWRIRSWRETLLVSGGASLNICSSLVTMWPTPRQPPREHFGDGTDVIMMTSSWRPLRLQVRVSLSTSRRSGLTNLNHES